MGYWDSVRFGADDERIARLRRAFGRASVVALETAPLAFQRDRAGSAINHEAFGAEGPYMGARLAYAQAQHDHHAGGNLRYASPGPAPNFPVPLAMRADRGTLSTGCDLIIGADLRGDGPLVRQVASIIGDAHARGDSVGLVQLSAPRITGLVGPSVHSEIMVSIRRSLRLPTSGPLAYLGSELDIGEAA